MSKKKSLGHSPFQSGQNPNSTNKTETALDDLISILLIQRDASQKSITTGLKKEIELPILRSNL